jgi:putative ABC transport system permease protein
VPLFGGSSTGFDVEGRPLAKPNERPMTDYRAASPGYLQTMGIDLVAGRAFTPNDKADSPPVAVINETLARRYFGTQNPIGKRIGLSRPIDWREIVGVVRDVRNYGLAEEVKTGMLPALSAKRARLSRRVRFLDGDGGTDRVGPARVCRRDQGSAA